MHVYTYLVLTFVIAYYWNYIYMSKWSDIGHLKNQNMEREFHVKMFSMFNLILHFSKHV